MNHFSINPFNFQFKSINEMKFGRKNHWIYYTIFLMIIMKYKWFEIIFIIIKIKIIKIFNIIYNLNDNGKNNKK